MNWFYLAIAIVSEVLATSALKASEGFTRLYPSLVVVVGYGLAFYFLSLTLRTIPVGIAYAVWSGVGIVLISLAGWVIYDQRLDAAAILGLVLGIDRELKGNPAGLRTHGLICFASAATTVSMLALYFQLGGSRVDALRLFEAVGAFVGLVGAGLVVFSRGQVKNLTTAAHVWLTSVIGIACGAGQWPVVAVATLASLVMITVLGWIERRYLAKRPEA